MGAPGRPMSLTRIIPTLVGLAEACDVLIAITPGGAETKHLIDATVMKALGPDGVLINVARGSVVDEQALIEALRDGTILAAGLDVFEDEPRVPQALIELDNVVLLPHIASASVHTRKAMGQLAGGQSHRVVRREGPDFDGPGNAMAWMSDR